MSRDLNKRIVIAPEEITIVGNADAASIAEAALAQGGHTVFLDDSETVPSSPEEALAFIEADIPKTGQLRATYEAQTGTPLEKCRDFLAAVKADGRASATSFVNRRTK